MFRQYKLKNYNFNLIICVFALSLIGYFAVGSAKESMQSKQLTGIIFGLVLMLLFSIIDYSSYLHFYWALYGINIVFLVCVLQFGKEVKGAKRWFSLFGLQFQPSELAKILLILFLAQYIMKHRDVVKSFKGMLQLILLFSIPLFLIFREPDLSTSVVCVSVFCVMIFIAGLSYKFIGVVMAAVIPLLVGFFALVLKPDSNILKDYQLIRILAWRNPEKYADSAAYQQLNSITAIGSGKLLGKGLNNNVIASVKNGNFISEPQTDFIYAVIGEELGFIGAFAVILLLVMIIWECLKIARRSKDKAGALVAAGVAGLIGIQSFFNISVATGVLPNTGIPLPFVSSGLTSLISLYTAIGIVLNIGLQQKSTKF